MLPERYDPKKDPNIDYGWELAMGDDHFNIYQFDILDTISIDKPLVGAGNPIFTGTAIPIQVMFDFIRDYGSIQKAMDIFLAVYPEVPKEQVLQMLHITQLPIQDTLRHEYITKQRIDIMGIISLAPGVLGGKPVFTFMRTSIYDFFYFVVNQNYHIGNAIAYFYSTIGYSAIRGGDPSVRHILDILSIIKFHKHPLIKLPDASSKELFEYAKKKRKEIEDEEEIKRITECNKE